jgi:1-acyl-sn-glycerol-3-phosphate acyltransferase
MAWFRLAGWKIEGSVPESERFVLIAAPHTSNWDFPFMMAVALGLRQKVYWMGKHTLFSGWKGPIARWLGGISVDRRNSHDVVGQSIAQYGVQDKLILVIAPEGTRGSVRSWKTGFYHVANGANVPIVTGFLDYSRKVGGVGPSILPTGDYEADMAKIWAFYSQIKGKFP